MPPLPQRHSKTCELCGEVFQTARKTTRFCKNRECYNHRQRRDWARTYKANPLSGQRRVCATCKQDFTPNSNGQKFCTPECHQERDRRAGRRSRLQIEATDWEAMYEAQGGCCAVCRRPSDKLAVDHCHLTNRVRKLLCRGCNLALGFIGEDAARAEALARYIRDECAPLVQSFLEDKDLDAINKERVAQMIAS